MAELPEVEFLILADHAEAVNGKLYLMGGGWDRRTVGDFRQPQTFAVAVAVLFPPRDLARPVTLSVVLIDAEGHNVAPPLQTQLNGRSPIANLGQPARYMLAANLQIILPRPGQYMVEATVGDGPPKRVSFVAESNPPMSGAGTLLH